jgi:hypothetical protein
VTVHRDQYHTWVRVALCESPPVIWESIVNDFADMVGNAVGGRPEGLRIIGQVLAGQEHHDPGGGEPATIVSAPGAITVTLTRAQLTAVVKTGLGGDTDAIEQFTAWLGVPGWAPPDRRPG